MQSRRAELGEDEDDEDKTNHILAAGSIAGVGIGAGIGSGATGASSSSAVYTSPTLTVGQSPVVPTAQRQVASVPITPSTPAYVPARVALLIPSNLASNMSGARAHGCSATHCPPC